jgi:hypothetical protein
MDINIREGRTVTVDGKAYKVLGIQGPDVHLEDEDGGRHVKPLVDIDTEPELTPAADEPDVEVSDDASGGDVPGVAGEATEAEEGQAEVKPRKRTVGTKKK